MHSIRRGLCVMVRCLLVTRMRYTKTAAPIEVPFVDMDSWGPNEPYSMWRPSWKGQFRGFIYFGMARLARRRNSIADDCSPPGRRSAIARRFDGID